MLIPNPHPSRIPAANAYTFFNAPAISTPITSFYVNNFKGPTDIVNYIYFANSSFSDATTSNVGIFFIISFANEGPEITQYYSLC